MGSKRAINLLRNRNAKHPMVANVDGMTSLYPNGTSAKTANFTAAAGYVYLITKLDGCAVTLPAITRVGDRIKLVFGGATSNSHTVTADATTTLFNGYALMQDTADGTAAAYEVFAPDGSDDDVITLNRTTTGVAGVIELVATASNRWFVEALLHSSGDAATPFG